MHGLAPAPAVARLREPAPPELDRLLEVPQRLLGREGVGHVALGHRLEHERLALTRLERELAQHALVADAEADSRGERERQRRSLEDDAVLVHDRLVRLAPVVEARIDLDAEAHLAPHAEHTADQPLPLADRHEVLQLADSDRGQEARDEDVRVGEVELLDGADAERRRDPIAAALLSVEDRPEDARRVEPRAAVPVDRAVGADERDRAQIADDAVLGDRQVLARRREREVDRAAEGAFVYARHGNASASRRTSACSSRIVTVGIGEQERDERRAIDHRTMHGRARDEPGDCGLVQQHGDLAEEHARVHDRLLHLVTHQADLAFEDQEQVGVLVALAQDPGSLVEALVSHCRRERSERLGRQIGEEREAPKALGERFRRGEVVTQAAARASSESASRECPQGWPGERW